jgi:hypothetical protein
LSERDPNPRDIRLEVEEWIAECLSLQPDRSLGISFIGSGWDALCLLYLLSHVENLYWITERIHRKIAQKAYASNYEGVWTTVQQMLELYPKTPEQFYEYFLRFYSPEDFFGNLKRGAKRLSRIVRSYKRDPHTTRKKTKRTRGYRDKGTYVPPHRPRVEPPEKDLLPDRRKKVGHPLIHEEDEDE